MDVLVAPVPRTMWVGGVLSAMILTLFVIPSDYDVWQWWKERAEFS
ncbi:MAG: hypothetical protein KF693_04760 [Nitrospira sp.]|nr:hypothetical protein [Nitrospira sp.]